MRPLTTLFTASAILLAAPSGAGAQEPAVHAVLFYSPTCPHCHQVIDNDLPPLRQKHGARLVIVGADVSTQEGSALYEAMVAHYAIPPERLGVPALLVGNTVLVGSWEIPQQFPGIIERGLAAGGIDWPPVQEIRQVLAAQGFITQRPAPPAPRESPPARGDTGAARGRPDQPSEAPARDTGRAEAAPSSGRPGDPPPAAGEAGAGVAPSPGEPVPGAAAEGTEPRTVPPEVAPRSGVGILVPGSAIPSPERPGPGALFLRDPVGNGMSVVVLLALAVVLVWSMTVMMRPGARVPLSPTWLFPALAVVGAGVAGYLSFVEVTGTAAVCGPVGDCNTVQQSEWATLFGFLPVGVLGLAGYAGLVAAWVAATWGPARLRHPAWTAAWAMALVGTAFSAYLTFLEPFVIGATCAWCLTSAVVIALMLVAATGRAAAPPPSPASDAP